MIESPENFEIIKRFENYEDFPLLLQIFTESLLSNKDPNFQRLENTPYSKEDCKLLQKAVQDLYKHSATDGQLSVPKNVPESVRTPLESCFKLYLGHIVNTTAKNHIIESGINLVDFFDWKFKWILGTSKLASIKEPILQVDLWFVKNSMKTVSFESEIGQIDELISCLSSVQKDLETNK